MERDFALSPPSPDALSRFHASHEHYVIRRASFRVDAVVSAAALRTPTRDDKHQRSAHTAPGVLHMHERAPRWRVADGPGLPMRDERASRDRCSKRSERTTTNSGAASRGKASAAAERSSACPRSPGGPGASGAAHTHRARRAEHRSNGHGLPRRADAI